MPDVLRSRFEAFRHSPRSAGLLVALLVAALVGTAQPAAGAERASEAAIKAIFVYNFTKFVEWPGTTFADARSPLVLCVSTAREDLLAALRALNGLPAQGRLIAVRADIPANEPKGCHALFVGADTTALAVEAANALEGVLTVSDAKDFAASGGVIELFSEGSKIRFEINPQAAKRAGLKVSAQLMKLARITPNR